MNNYPFTHSPEELQSLQRSAVAMSNQEKILEVLGEVDEKIVAAAEAMRQGRPTQLISVMLQWSYSREVISGAVDVLNKHGFKAAMKHIPGYDDGPNRSSPDVDCIEIAL